MPRVCLQPLIPLTSKVSSVGPDQILTLSQCNLPRGIHAHLTPWPTPAWLPSLPALGQALGGHQDLPDRKICPTSLMDPLQVGSINL